MLHTLFALKFDGTVTVNNIINSLLTLAVVALGHGVRKVYCSIRAYFEHIETMGTQLEDTSTVVDTHTTALQRSGLAEGLEMPKVSKQRRREDHQTLPL